MVWLACASDLTISRGGMRCEGHEKPLAVKAGNLELVEGNKDEL